MILEVLEEAPDVEVRSTIIGAYLIAETSSGRSLTIKKGQEEAEKWEIMEILQ